MIALDGTFLGRIPVLQVQPDGISPGVLASSHHRRHRRIYLTTTHLVPGIPRPHFSY